MATTATKTRKFENRVRFNWGYHDAASVVRNARQGQNYGFDQKLNITKPEDVLEQHFDETYARGWLFGYYEALGGGVCEVSDFAWQTAIELGTVTE